MDFTQTIAIAKLTAGFTLAGSVMTLIANLIQGVIKNKHQVKMEKIRIHDAERFKAYNNAYAFLEYLSFDPSEALWDDEVKIIKIAMQKNINPYIAILSKKVKNGLHRDI